MQETNFEKEVRERMEELRLRPSTAVWDNLEEILRAKRRRRILILLPILLGMLLLGTVGYYFYGVSRHSSKSGGLASARGSVGDHKSASDHGSMGDHGSASDHGSAGDRRPNTAAQSGKSATSADRIDSIQHAGGKPNTISKNALNRSGSGVSTGGSAMSSQHAGSQAAKTRQAAQNNRIRTSVRFPESAKADPVTKEHRATAIEPEMIAGSISADTDINLKNSLSTPDKSTASAQSAIKAADTATLAQSAIAPIHSAIATDSAITAQSPIAGARTREKKFRYIIDISGGQSTQRTGINIGSRKEIALDPTSVGNPGAPTVFHLPSAYERGAAIQATFGLEFTVSKTETVSAGIGYAYRSNEIGVGAFINDTLGGVSLDNGYYVGSGPGVNSGGDSVNLFKNQYHFISLPLRYNVAFISNRKLDIGLSLGLSFNYLIASKALIYSQSHNGVYFRDKGYYRQLQVGFSGGLFFTPGRRKAWSFGPELGFNVSKLGDDSYDTRQHLSYGALNARYRLPIKK